MSHMLTIDSDFSYAISAAASHLFYDGEVVHTEKWQRLDIQQSKAHEMLEVLNHTLACDISTKLDVLKQQIKPNIPWADDHFLERVGGVPLNPGSEYKNWPYYRNNTSNDIHRKEGKFSHTYMERIWPKGANRSTATDLLAWYEHPDQVPIPGIRYGYGDFNDVVNLMIAEPLTRQAFLPIWFPEDTGVVHGERVPCTLGYHFIMRNNQLHCVYYIRSCDFFRHFRDDIYLACRKVIWLLDQLRERGQAKYNWHSVTPGVLTMHITSLHCFAQEKPMVARAINR